MRATRNNHTMARHRKDSVDAPPVTVIPGRGAVSIEYRGGAAEVGFDVCDEHGRVLQTGHLKGRHTVVDLSFLRAGRYILLILDGDVIRNHPFELLK